MAITFSKSISEVNFLNAYNNSIVEFASDSILDSVKCEILIGGFPFVITPINNVFRFNFREIVKVLINTNNFKDSSIPSLMDDITIDESLVGSWSVTYTITFENDTTEVTAKDYSFLKSVEQIDEWVNKPIADHFILNQNELTFFKGYPFDLAYYNTANFTLTNNTINTSKTFTPAVDKVVRIWFNDGEFELSETSEEKNFNSRALALVNGFVYSEDCYVWDEDYLFREGLNNMTLSNGTNTDIELAVTQKEVCDGVYLKWVNEQGAFSYWLFNSVYKDNINVKTIDTFNTDFENIEDTYTTRLTTGKEAVNTLNLYTDRLTRAESLQIESILTSPRVELYNNKNDEIIDATSWQTVIVSDGTFNVLDTKNNLSKLAITIIKNKYTQS